MHFGSEPNAIPDAGEKGWVHYTNNQLHILTSNCAQSIATAISCTELLIIHFIGSFHVYPPNPVSGYTYIHTYLSAHQNFTPQITYFVEIKILRYVCHQFSQHQLNKYTCSLQHFIDSF